MPNVKRTYKNYKTKPKTSYKGNNKYINRIKVLNTQTYQLQKQQTILQAKANSVDYSRMSREEKMLYKLQRGTIDLNLGTKDEYQKLQEQLHTMDQA